MRETKLVCSFTLLIAACATAGGQDSGLGTEEHIVAVEATRFPAEEGVLVNTIVEPDRVQLAYSAGVPHFVPGDVVTGTEGGGYLRRVISADETGDTVTLHTEQAAFGDAFETVRLQRSVHVVPDVTPGEPVRADFVRDVATPEGVWRAHVTHDAPILPAAPERRGPAVIEWVFPNISITLKDLQGNVRMTLAAEALRVTKRIDVEFDVDYSWFKLQRLELIKDETSTISLTNVSIGVSGVLPLVDYSIPIYENPAVATIPVSVVAITVGVSIDVGVFAKLAASATIETTSELALETHSRQGFVYDGNYDIVWQRDLEGYAEITHASASVTPVMLTAGAFIDAAVSLRLYGVLGPEFYGRFYPVHAELSFGTTALHAQLSARARAGARFELPVFGLTVFDVPFVEYEHPYGDVTKPY